MEKYTTKGRVLTTATAVAAILAIIIWAAVIILAATQRKPAVEVYPMANAHMLWAYTGKGGAGQ